MYVYIYNVICVYKNIVYKYIYIYVYEHRNGVFLLKKVEVCGASSSVLGWFNGFACLEAKFTWDS